MKASGKISSIGVCSLALALFQQVHAAPSFHPADIDNNEIGNRIPLILIHGIQSDPSIWNDFLNYWNSSPDLRADFKPYVFGYHTDIPHVGADDPSDVFGLGRALGTNLAQYYASSPHSPTYGFNGKPVVILAHSMGGLVARSMMATYHFPDAPHGGDKVSLLITLATPHHGTPAANDYYVAPGPYQSVANIFFDLKPSFALDMAWDCSDGRQFGFFCGATIPSDADYSKVIAYGAKTTAIPLSDVLLYVVPFNFLAFSGYDNDGIVPLPSSLFNGAPIRTRQVNGSCDHSEIYKGQKTVASGTPIFDSLAADLETVVLIAPLPPTISLTALSISGSSTINENSTAQFTAYATFSDGSSYAVPSNWTENSIVTTISTSGLLSAGEVTANTPLVISASYTAGGVTASATKSVTVINNSGGTCTYALSALNHSHGAGSENGSVTVTTGSSCSWSATSGTAWITIGSGANTVGSGTVNYTILANTNSQPRTGTFTVAGQTFTVIQANPDCAYSLSPTSGTHGSGAENGTVQVTTSPACTWIATTSDSWIQLGAGANNIGTSTVSYSVTADNGPQQRIGNIVIAGQNFTVTQAGGSCAYSLSPNQRYHGTGLENGVVFVTAGNGCAWTAASSDSWITIGAGGSGTGNGTFSYTVLGTVSADARVGTISVGSKTFTIVQAGTSIPPGNYTLTSQSANGSITRNPDQPNYAAGTVVTLTATPISGYVFSGWAGDARGTDNPLQVTMNGNKNVAVRFTQLGSSSSILTEDAPFVYNVGADGGSAQAVVKNAGSGILYWSAIASDLWLKVLIGGNNPIPGPSGSAGLPFSWETNHTTSQRTGTVTIYAPGAQQNPQTLTIIQSPGTPITYPLTVSATNGTVSKNPDQSNYNAGSQVILTANPATDFVFDSWSGDASGTNNPVNVTMDKSRSVVANFVPTPQAGLALSVNSLSAESSLGSGSFSVLNAGNANLDWTATSSDAWLTNQTVSGSTAPGQTSAVNFSFGANLTTNNRMATITISAPSASPSSATFALLQHGIVPPLVTILLTSNKVVLSWPTNATGFTLESATNTPTASWTSNSTSPAIVNGQFTVTNSISGAAKFYRLKK